MLQFCNHTWLSFFLLISKGVCISIPTLEAGVPSHCFVIHDVFLAPINLHPQLSIPDHHFFTLLWAVISHPHHSCFNALLTRLASLLDQGGNTWALMTSASELCDHSESASSSIAGGHLGEQQGTIV